MATLYIDAVYINDEDNSVPENLKKKYAGDAFTQPYIAFKTDNNGAYESVKLIFNGIDETSPTRTVFDRFSKNTLETLHIPRKIPPLFLITESENVIKAIDIAIKNNLIPKKLLKSTLDYRDRLILDHHKQFNKVLPTEVLTLRFAHINSNKAQFDEMKNEIKELTKEATKAGLTWQQYLETAFSSLYEQARFIENDKNIPGRKLEHLIIASKTTLEEIAIVQERPLEDSFLKRSVKQAIDKISSGVVKKLKLIIKKYEDENNKLFSKNSDLKKIDDLKDDYKKYTLDSIIAIKEEIKNEFKKLKK